MDSPPATPRRPARCPTLPEQVRVTRRRRKYQTLAWSRRIISINAITSPRHTPRSARHLPPRPCVRSYHASHLLDKRHETNSSRNRSRPRPVSRPPTAGSATDRPGDHGRESNNLMAPAVCALLERSVSHWRPRVMGLPDDGRLHGSTTGLARDGHARVRAGLPPAAVLSAHAAHECATHVRGWQAHALARLRRTGSADVEFVDVCGWWCATQTRTWKKAV